MAYNSGYDPDALPAHAEPEQAAAMLSAMQMQDNTPQQPSYNKPQPPVPRPQQAPHAYSAPPGGPYTGGESPFVRPPAASGGLQSPPPSNYGLGPPPQRYHNRPPIQSKTPPASAPPAGADASLFPTFRAVDQDGSGRLSEQELRSALVNSDYTTFDPHTVRMMIRMFNTDGRGTIGFDEFCNLWGFLAAWRSLFERFDEDRSGNITLNEFGKALIAFGYRLSPQFVQLLFKTYDKRGTNAMSFDLFVQSCISLKRMTDVFKKFDEDRDGYITLSFEEFLTEILRQR